MPIPARMMIIIIIGIIHLLEFFFFAIAITPSLCAGMNMLENRIFNLIFGTYGRLTAFKLHFKVPCCFPVTIKCKSKDHVNTTSDKPEKFNPFVKKFEFLREQAFGVFLDPYDRICRISLFYMHLSFIYLERRPL